MMIKSQNQIVICPEKNEGAFYLSVLFMQFLLYISKTSLHFWSEINQQQRLEKHFPSSF